MGTVYIIDREGREASMYRVRASESCLFAINALFGNVPYPAWVRVTSDTATILMIPAPLLKELHHQEKAVRDWVFSVQSQRIFEIAIHATVRENNLQFQRPVLFQIGDPFSHVVPVRLFEAFAIGIPCVADRHVGRLCRRPASEGTSRALRRRGKHVERKTSGR